MDVEPPMGEGMVDFVLEDSEDERQGSGHGDPIPFSSNRDPSMATVDPALVFPPPPISESPSGLTVSPDMAESSIGGSTMLGAPEEEPPVASETPAPLVKARKVSSLGKKEKGSVFVGVEVLIAQKRTKAKTKKAAEAVYKSAETIDDSDEEEEVVSAVSSKKPSPRRGRTRSASIVSQAASAHTDYDEQPPHVKAAARKKQRRVRDSSAGQEEEVEAGPSMPAEAPPNTSKRSRSNSVTSAASGARSKKRHLSPAISEDGGYEDVLAQEVAQANARASEDDSDFGESARRKGTAKAKGKGKGKAKERVKKDKAAPKEKKARAPRKKKGAVVVEPEEQQDDSTTVTTEEPSTGSARADPSPPLPPPAASTSAAAQDVDMDEEEAAVVAPAAKSAPKPRKKVARLIVESDEDEEGEAAPVVPFEKSKGKKATDGSTRKKSKSKRVVDSEDDGEFQGDGEDDSVAKEIDVDDDEEEDRSPVKRNKRKPSKSSGKGKEKELQSPVVARQPVAGGGRRGSNNASRIAAIMQAAQEEEDTSFLDPMPRKDAAPSQATSGDKSDAESVKENDAPAPAKVAAGTPLAAVPKRLVGSAGRAGTPGSAKSTPKAKGLAGVLQKTGLHGYRAPGLSSRQKIPSLHKNLQPPPPPKAAIKEKERKKKTQEVYSDEELPWYETKDPEEWDDEDHYRWQQIKRRKEMGLDDD